MIRITRLSISLLILLKRVNNDTPNARAKKDGEMIKALNAELAVMAGHASGFAKAARC